MQKALRFLIRTISILLALYIGGWQMMAQPVLNIYHAVCMNSLTLSEFIGAGIKLLLSSTVIGAIWCAGYIVAGYFREYEDE